MADCFRGCGRTVKGIRLRASNGVAQGFRTDVALFRGAIADRVIAPVDVASRRIVSTAGGGE